VRMLLNAPSRRIDRKRRSCSGCASGRYQRAGTARCVGHIPFWGTIRTLIRTFLAFLVQLAGRKVGRRNTPPQLNGGNIPVRAAGAASLGLWLVLGMALLARIGMAEDQPGAVVNAESQKQATQLVQKVIQDYWNGGDDKSASAAAKPGSSTNVETAFRKAVQLLPDRLDLRFGLASSLLGEAIQTNRQQLDTKMREALKVYQDIQALDTNSFEAPILYAAYARSIGETNASQATINRLMTFDAERTSEYVQKFSQVDQILQLIPNEKAHRTMPKNKRHAIVVLGAGLETNGTMKPKLISRLQQGLRLARIYPRSPIILTGGNPKGGITEAYAMGLWYAQRGVSRKRLFLEDRARDTVENALFSSAILERLRVTHVTLVTSYSHIRRGLCDLQEACLQRRLDLQYDHLAARTKGDLELDTKQERVGIYRDLMRTSGLWAFPGIQR